MQGQPRNYMSKLKVSKEFKVGVFAVISLSILYIGFNYLKGIEFLNKTDQYYAVYNDVAGLTVSNPIKINGFSVGRVSDVSIMQGNENKILVELDLMKDIVLGDSAIALLKIDLLGGVSIVLEVGDLTRPISPGDTIIAKVDPTLTEVLAESAIPVASSLQTTIRRINILLEDFSGNTESLNKLIKNVEGITSKTNSILANSQKNIETTMSDLSVISGKLSKNLDQLSDLLINYNQLADTLKNIELNNTLAQTNELLGSMNKTFENLNDENGTLGRLMKDDSLYVSLNQTLIDLDRMLIHMNENPKHFFAPLGKSKKKIERDLAKEQKN